MSKTTHARGAALARVARLYTAARRHGETHLTTDDIGLALEGVDVEALAWPKPAPARVVVGMSRKAVALERGRYW